MPLVPYLWAGGNDGDLTPPLLSTLEEGNPFSIMTCHSNFKAWQATKVGIQEEKGGAEEEEKRDQVRDGAKPKVVSGMASSIYVQYFVSMLCVPGSL